MIERDKEYYNQKISELYTVIENQEKIIRDLQTEIFGLNDRLSCANEELDLYKSVLNEVRELTKNQIKHLEDVKEFYKDCQEFKDMCFPIINGGLNSCDDTIKALDKVGDK